MGFFLIPQMPKNAKNEKKCQKYQKMSKNAKDYQNIALFFFSSLIFNFFQKSFRID